MSPCTSWLGSRTGPIAPSTPPPRSASPGTSPVVASPQATRSATAHGLVPRPTQRGRPRPASAAWNARLTATSSGHRASGAASPPPQPRAHHPATTQDPSTARTGRGTRNPGPVRSANTSASQDASAGSWPGLSTASPTRQQVPWPPGSRDGEPASAKAAGRPVGSLLVGSSSVGSLSGAGLSDGGLSGTPLGSRAAAGPVNPVFPVRRRPVRLPIVPIRPRQPGDPDACVAVLRRVHDRSGYPGRWPADPAHWLTPEGLIAAWVAEHEGAIVGQVGLAQGDQHPGLLQAVGRPVGELVEITRLFVDPAVRGAGLGRELLAAASSHAMTSGLRPVLE